MKEDTLGNTLVYHKFKVKVKVTEKIEPKVSDFP